MIGRDNEGDIHRYGLAPWILGVVLAAVFTWIMFAYALPIGD